jgi:hypothetical protein
MKWPTDKKSRIQIMAVIAIGCIAAVYGGIVGVMRPLSKVKDERALRIEDIQEKLRKARLAVDHMAADETANSNTLHRIIDIAQRRNLVLHDILGNYLLGATPAIEKQADRAGVKVGSVEEAGMRLMPAAPGRKATPAFKAYTARVALQCRTHELVRLLSQIETNNTYLCVTSLAINAQPDKPDSHSVTMEIQWPVWADAAVPVKLEAKLKEIAQSALDSGNKPAAAVAGSSGGKH